MFCLSSFVIVLIILDQLIKYLIVSNMFLGESIPIIPHLLHLTYILNPGAAFGILENQRFFFILIAIILICTIIYFYPKIIKLNKSFQLGIAMLFSGAIGNMIDRIFIGKVIDYIDFRIWPILTLLILLLFVAASSLFMNYYLSQIKEQTHD